MYSNEKQYWVVGYSEFGRWQVRYSDIENPQKYTLVEDLGPSLLDADLEFDGDFQTFGDDTHISLVTESLPWLFVVTTTRKLYVKKVREGLDKAQLLSTDVIQVSVCRGFKSDNYEKDSGLVVAYLKSDGSVWYKVRRLSDNGSMIWSEEFQIPQAGLGNQLVQVIRLNDFRTGIYVKGCNKLFISYSEYIGDTVRTEYVLPDVAMAFQTVPFRDVSTDNVANFEILTVKIVEPEVIQVHANYPLFDFDPEWDRIQKTIYLTKSTIVDQDIVSIDFQNGDMFITLAKPTSTGLERFWFSVSALNRLGYLVSDWCKPIWPSISFSTPEPPPVEITEYVGVEVDSKIQFLMIERREYEYEFEEKVTPILDSSIDFANSPVFKGNMGSTEYVNTNVDSTIAFSIIQVGTSPI